MSSSSSYTAQQKVLAILPKCTGALSLFGSVCIIYDILNKRGNKLQTFHRIMLGLSCFDVICSICNVASTWPTPSEQSEAIFMAVGTTGTCTAQGFFNELGNVGAVCYSTSLAIHYGLKINSGQVRHHLTKGQEAWLHGIPILLAVTMAMVGLPLTLYNNSGWLCWYAPYPKGCAATNSCTRGAQAGLFRWIHYAIVWSAIATVTISMFFIFRVVRETEKRANTLLAASTSTWNMPFHSGELSGPPSTQGAAMKAALKREQREKRKKSARTKRVAFQACLYVGGLYLTWIFTTLTRIFQTAVGVTHLELLILMALFFPLQGFFNALIYFRSQRGSMGGGAGGARGSISSRSRNSTLAASSTMGFARRSSLVDAPTTHSAMPFRSTASSDDRGYYSSDNDGGYLSSDDGFRDEEEQLQRLDDDEQYPSMYELDDDCCGGTELVPTTVQPFGSNSNNDNDDNMETTLSGPTEDSEQEGEASSSSAAPEGVLLSRMEMVPADEEHIVEQTTV